MGIAARLDNFQRRHTWLGFPVAVVYKFIEDQGGYLAVLITYYGFASLFPLLLLLVSVLGFTLEGDPALQQALLGSALQQFPIIGPQLQQNISSIRGSTLGVVLGIIGAVYGGLGISVAIQTALNRVWAVPRFARPDPVVSRLRGLVLFILLGTVILITTALSALGPLAAGFGYGIGTGVRVAAAVVAIAANVAVFLIAFRLLTARDVRLADLMPGAVGAAVAVQGLQMVGTFLARRGLNGVSQLYGVFGLVLGLLAWLYLLAMILVLCAEINAVRARRLWPRNLLIPFIDDVNLTPADQASYRSYADTERHKPFARVRTTFDRPDRK
ncbi:MAG TPA: YhjD/YihY/BrkB family envelope integrity protein [Pseudonocardiaceae bacterium]|jgi:YihY family inner membrane protein|nr:YhjD/YihY/BrkB family envelope integrity protein [Pseudonocardiaceae bacterium]